MGVGASAESQTQQLCRVCFDVGDLAPQPPASQCVHYRPSSLEAWLQHWELPVSLFSYLHTFGFESPLDGATKYTKEHGRVIADALVHLELHMDQDLTSRWSAALKHARHLAESTSAYDTPGSPSLRMWLECWRLHHLTKEFEVAWKCKTRDDITAVESTVSAAVKIGMLPLEVRRWRRAQQLLKFGVQYEHQLQGLSVSRPSLQTWLATFELGRFFTEFAEFGAEDVEDVVKLDKFSLESFGFSERDLRQWGRAVEAVDSPVEGHSFTSSARGRRNQQHSALGRLEHTSLRAYLDSFNLSRFERPLLTLGAAAPVDLLDLSAQEVSDLSMLPLEARRWVSAMKRLQVAASEPVLMNAVLPRTGSAKSEEEAASIDRDSIHHLMHSTHEQLKPSSKPIADRDSTHLSATAQDHFKPSSKPAADRDLIHPPANKKKEHFPTDVPLRPVLRHLSEIDNDLLGKLRYRWMATSYTVEGKRARQEWLNVHQPPDFDHDESWLALNDFRELCRHVLQISRLEVSDFEIELFFDALNHGSPLKSSGQVNGHMSFYKFIGILETDPAHEQQSRKHRARRKKKRQPRSEAGYSNPEAWRPPGPKDRPLSSSPPSLRGKAGGASTFAYGL